VRRLLLVLCGLAVVVPGLRAAVAPGRVAWDDINKQPAAWYATEEARAIALRIVEYQTPSGGWPKNRDMTAPPDAEFLANQEMDHRAATIDNDATTLQLQYLARVIAAPEQFLSRGLNEAFFKGFDYLLAAQYPNGGWPQYFPLQEGYYTHITFNDGAMIKVMEVLRDAATGQAPYAFVDSARRAKARAAVDLGVACILKCQVVVDGAKTVWCAQHDEKTFAAAKARAYEHPSLSGGESQGIVRFLMAIDRPGPEVIAAVTSAMAWFEKVKVTGLRYDRRTPPALPVPDPAAPPLLARFYEIGTNRPIFSGRDSVVRYTLDEVEMERRTGYNWYIAWPQQLIGKDYPAWRIKWLPAR
jgi:PelA/Pel-15E family pectate lyase